mgnify:CR=1 FL=1
MNRTQKEALVNDLSQAIATAPLVILADYKGATVHETEDVRNKLRENGLRLQVVKNTLMKRCIRKYVEKTGEEKDEGQLREAEQLLANGGASLVRYHGGKDDDPPRVAFLEQLIASRATIFLYSAASFYIIVYTIMSLGAFGMVTILSPV